MDEDLRKRAQNAAGAIFFVGGLSLLVGLIAVFFHVEFLQNLGIGFWSVAEGALFLYLGHLVRNGSASALWIAIALYGIEILYSIVVMVQMKMPSASGSMLVRGWLLYTMFRGVGAVGQTGDAPGPAPHAPRFAPEPRSGAQQPRFTGEAGRRHTEMTSLTRAKIDNPAPLPGELRRFDVGGKDSVSTAAASLRFVAYRCEITPQGLKALYSNGTTRELEWANIASLVVRQLPPDKPWEGRVVLDLLPATVPGFPTPPLRIFASTYVNYAALPGGQAAGTLDNIRRLAAHVAAQNPSLIADPLSAPFVLRNQPPHRVSLSQFVEYDTRYPDN